VRVGIVGGGIGGLTAAIALRRAGVDAVVFEESPEPRAVGAGLHLWSNAVRALRELDLGDIERIAVEIEREFIYKANGKLMIEWPVGELGRELGAASIGLTRPGLLRFLLDRIDANALELGRRVERFTDDGERVVLSFADGEETAVDLLVGADGLLSTVRTQLWGTSRPRYAGYASWRTLVPAAHDDPGPPAVRQYWGRGGRVVCFPAGEEQMYVACLGNAPAGETNAAGATIQELRARFGSFAEPIPKLIDRSIEPAWIRMDIVDRKPIETWGRGRVTLLGDAAHPMTPNTSQGAGMAIEDAVVLARCLRDASASPEVLRAYERARAKRANSQIKTARFAGSLGRVENALLVRARDLFIRLTFGSIGWRQQRTFVGGEF
jgi:2-polyprenyl-6-methoxyphenol hydroxylase-like FAD-dependent oxidoreductase